MSYTERDLIDLACRAPACPDWFKPKVDTSDLYCENVHLLSQGDLQVLADQYDVRIKAAKLAQWPKAYARMVLEAA